MYVKVEPGGCCERKGLVQIKFAMYLEPEDYGYEIYYMQLPERPLTEEELADPELAEKVPKVWCNTDFHMHFIYVEPDTPDEEIMDIGEVFLEESYILWACGEELNPKNPPIKFHINPDGDRLKAIEDKLKHLKETTLERSIGSY